VVLPSAGFSYARLMSPRQDGKYGDRCNELVDACARARQDATLGDDFLYYISCAKKKNPSAAMALLDILRK